MSTKLGWFGLQNGNHGEVVDALHQVARSERKIALPEDGFRIASKRGTSSVVLLGWEYASVHDWARGCSRVLATTTMSFFLLEGCWDYSIHDRGKQLAAMTWYPEAKPKLTGDVDRAGAALNVPGSVLRRYHDAIVAYIKAVDDDEDAEPGRAFPEDKYEIGDDWVHCMLAERAGFHYPDPGTGQVVTISRS
jgi:hypothetical protein